MLDVLRRLSRRLFINLILLIPVNKQMAVSLTLPLYHNRRQAFSSASRFRRKPTGQLPLSLKYLQRTQGRLESVTTL